MIEFIIGLAIGMMISGSDLGEPVPYQTITYSDSGKVVNIITLQRLNIVICLMRML